jgi:hypothetical protein
MEQTRNLAVTHEKGFEPKWVEIYEGITEHRDILRLLIKYECSNISKIFCKISLTEDNTYLVACLNERLIWDFYLADLEHAILRNIIPVKITDPMSKKEFEQDQIRERFLYAFDDCATKRNFTDKELCELIGMFSTSISYMRSKTRHPTTLQIAALCKISGYTLDYIIFGKRTSDQDDNVSLSDVMNLLKKIDKKI